MSEKFKGEYIGTSGTVEIGELSLPKKISVAAAFAGLFISILLVFFSGSRSVGIYGICFFGFIFMPWMIGYVFSIPRKDRAAIYILMSAGVLGIVGKTVLSLYLREHEFTQEFAAIFLSSILFIVFFGSGLVMLIAGLKRHKKKKQYSCTVNARVAGYREMGTNKFIGYDSAPEIASPENNERRFSPVYDYEVNGMTCRKEINSYYRSSELPPIGGEIEAHVDPNDPDGFITDVPDPKLFMIMGISFLAGSLVIIAVYVLGSMYLW